MATKNSVEQAIIDQVNAKATTAEPKDLVYLAESIKGLQDGTTTQEILANENDMLIRGVSGLEAISKATIIAEAQAGFSGGSSEADFVKPFAMEPLFKKTNAYTMYIPAGFTCVVAGVTIDLAVDYELNLNIVGNGGLDTGSRVAGTDYYVFATETENFIVSASNTLPNGFTANQVRLIGGFHYGLVPETFTAINNISADDANSVKGIWARSAWDLQWMPSCGDARGVTYNILGGWNDIYICNADHIVHGTSKAGINIAGGSTSNGRAIPKIPLAYGGDGSVTYGKMTWYNTAEIASAYKKRLLDQAEFQALAYGVKEASSAGGADNGIIKHIADYLSPYMEQATGVQYIWSNMVFSDTVPTGWQADKTDGRGSVYSEGSNPKAARLGGYSNGTSNSGSRCSHWDDLLWYSYWTIGGRFACDHLNLAPARTVVSA